MLVTHMIRLIIRDVTEETLKKPLRAYNDDHLN